MSDAEDYAAIKALAIANLKAVLASPNPTYDIDGQKISWTEYKDSLERTIKWADEMLDGTNPTEVHSVGIVGRRL